MVACLFPLAATAANTNTLTFSSTTVTTTSGNGVGPNNPANGTVTISGTSLNAGDVVIFDGVVNDVPGSTSDAWGSVDLNGSGYGGVVYATLGVLAETGTASGNQCQLFLNGTGSSTKFGTAQGSTTNRVRIQLTCTTTGSTTNMNYLVQIDQGITGTFSGSLSGSGVTFANNTISLNFGANNATHQFTQTQPIITVSAPANVTVASGLKATFSASITQGFPLLTKENWLSNSIPLPGATNLTYTTPATSSSYNGAQYSLVVSNLITPANVVTSSAALLSVRSVPGYVPFVFGPTTITNTAVINPLSPPANIPGTELLAGDTVVFDAIITTNGALTGAGDGWVAINLLAGGFQGLTAAQLGLLVRLGAGTGQLYINGTGPVSPNPTSAGALTNRARIELYPSVTGSTTNMGWLVKIDQNLTGTFLSAVTGTNLTFTNNTIPLSFGSYSVAGLITPEPVGLQSLQVSLSATNLVIGGFEPVTVTGNYLNESNVVLAANAAGLTYASSNTNVVTVSTNGLLTAAGAGQATLTVTDASLTATGTVWVANPGTLNNVSLVLSNQMALYSTQQISVIGTFTSATNINLFNYGQTTFTMNNTNIVRISPSGLMTAIAPGTAQITAYNGGLNSAFKSVTVTAPTNQFIFETFGDGFWNIVNQGNANNLVISSTGASQATSTNTAFDQQFELLYNYQNSTFRIRNRTTWQCLAANAGNVPGTRVLPVTYTGTSLQQWYLISVGTGVYRIVNAATGLALQSDNGTPASCTLVNAATSPFQYWSFSYQAHYPKKGCVGSEANYAQFGLSWAYNYDDGPSVSLPTSMDFVPMIYDALYWEPLSAAQSLDSGWTNESQPDYLLAYNEPDNASQANTSTNTVISLWPQIEALNVPIVGPAVQNTFDTWQYNFFTLLTNNSYRMDDIGVHEYVPPSASSMMSVLQSVYNTWGYPVWLTEFSPVDWSNTKSWSEDDDYNFLAEFMWQAESQNWLKRYSVFTFSGTNSASPWVDNGYTGTFFLADGVTLSPYGELYAAWDANLTVQARRPYILHNPGTSFRLTDTNAIGSPTAAAGTPKSSTIYVRNATTEWALLPAPTTNHWYIISLNDGRRLRNNGGTLDLAPYGTTNSAVDWWFNGPDSNGYYYLDNLAASQSIQATGSPPAIAFGMVNDPAPSTATQWRLVEPYQPVTIVTAAPPAVIISYTNQGATLTWAGTGLYYNVYRGTTSGGPYTKVLSLTTNTTDTDSSLQNGHAYYYVVTAMDILGEESTYSTEVVARPAASTAIPITSTVTNSALQFTWPADHTGWRLQVNSVGLTSPNAWTNVAGASATNWMLLPLSSTQTNVFYRLVYP